MEGVEDRRRQWREQLRTDNDVTEKLQDNVKQD